jgi:WD40 repeat protein
MSRNQKSVLAKAKFRFFERAVWVVLAWVVSTAFLARDTFAGDSYAFLVGVMQYDKTQFNSLQFSENDVTALSEQLQKVGFSKDNIVLMTQTSGAKDTRYLPTKANISKQFGVLLKELQPEDTVLVVFSGHGVQFKNDSTHYFCPADAILADKSSLISVNQMYSTLSSEKWCRAQNKLLIVDACRNDPVSALSRSAGGAKGIDLEPIGVKRTAPPKGLAAIYSCRENEMSWEHPELKHGVFLYHVIQAFGGQGDLDKDGELSLQELTQFTVKNTQRFVRKEFSVNQTPETLVEGEGLMTLAAFGAKPSNLKTIQKIEGEIIPVDVTAGKKELVRLQRLTGGPDAEGYGSWYCIVFSKDSKRIFAINEGNRFFGGSSIAGWDIGNARNFLPNGGWGNIVSRTANVPKSRTRDAIALRGEGGISILDLQNRRLTGPIPCNHTYGGVLTVSDGDKLLLSADATSGDLIVFDKAMKQKASYRLGRPVQQAAFTRDADRVLFSSGGEVLQWNFSGDDQVATHKIHQSQLWMIESNGVDDRILSIAGQLNVPADVQIWDLVSEKRDREVAIGRKTCSIAVSSDWNYAFVGESDGFVGLWDLFTGELVGEEKAFDGAVNQVAFSPNDKLVAARQGQKDVIVWTLKGDKEEPWLPGSAKTTPSVSPSQKTKKSGTK